MKKGYTDAGKIIPGARKFKYIENYSDIKDLSLNEQYAQARKDKIFPVPEPSGDEYIDFIKKTIRSSLRAKPRRMTRESIMAYVQKVKMVSNAVDEIKTPLDGVMLVNILNSLNRSDLNELLWRPLTVRSISRESMEKAKTPKKRKAKPKRAQPVLLDKLERVGPPRHGVGAYAEDLVESFNLYGVQYGNWVTDKERVNLTETAYLALSDMAAALNLPLEALGFGGTLGLAFGARGNGRASAHYEMDFKAINLTRFKGRGSLAHEWGHALDHALGIKYTLGGGMASSQYWLSPIPEFKNLMSFLTKWDSQNYQEALKLERAEHRRKKYWTSDTEIFARAFQVYIIDTLERMGIKNDFLSTMTVFKLEDGTEICPYPTGAEREESNRLFDELFNALAREKFFGDYSNLKVASL